MAENKSVSTSCSASLGLIYCVALLVFMFQSDWLSGVHPTYEDFMKISPIVMLASDLVIICCAVCLVVCSAAKDSGGPLMRLPVLIMLYIVFSLAFYIAAAVFMFDTSNFTAAVSDIYRQILGISAIVFAAFTGLAVCLGVCVGVAASRSDEFHHV